MIKCRNVCLKTIEKEDLEDIFKIVMEDDMGAAFASTYQELTLNGLAAYLYDTTKNTTSKVFVIRERDKNIGFITLVDICPIKRSAEIGCLGLTKKYQKSNKKAFYNASYAMEACGALAIYAFEVLNLHRLYAYTFSDNPNVNMIYKTGGFKKEGEARDYLCKNCKWLNRLQWSLLVDEYRNSKDWKKMKEFLNWK